jgi:hypothetical protein
MNPRDRTLPDLVLTIDGADLWRWGIKSGMEGAKQSGSVVEIGGELCGLRIIGTGEVELRGGSGVRDDRRNCETSLEGSVTGDSPAPVCETLALSMTFIGLLLLDRPEARLVG